MHFEVPFRLIVVCLLLFAGLLTGCRTYGGYGSEEAAIEEMAQAVDNYADLLARARTVLSGLREAEGETPEMASVVDRYESLVEAHAILLEEHRAQVAALAGSDDYRRISRVLGAITVEQRLTQRQYTEVLGHASRAGADGQLVVRNDSTARLAWSRINVGGHYYFTPPYYEQVRRRTTGALPRLQLGAQTDTMQ